LEADAYRIQQERAELEEAEEANRRMDEVKKR